jgi:hypothetical protein
VDFSALDLEKLAYFCGICFYVESTTSRPTTG